MDKLTASEAKELLDSNEKVTIVDSRSDDAWALSDVKAAGALRIPPDKVEEHLADIDREHPVVVYCT